MTKIRIIIPLLLLLVASFSAEARFHRAVLRDSLLNELRHVSNPHDSLDIYLDILDLAVNKDRSGSIREIYRLAQRTHNITVQLEMLQRMANLYASSENPDSLFYRCEQLANALPESDMQRATLVFINMIRITAKSHEFADSARREFFRNEIMSYGGDEKSSAAEQIRHHYAAMMFIGGSARYPMRSANIVKLVDLVRKLPVEMENVRNLCFTQSAIMFTRLGEKKLAVAVDREMLAGMKVMSERYRRQGRPYRTYQPNIYNCLRRMIMNYEALVPGEADSIYVQAHAIARENPDVASDLLSDERVEAFYLLAKGRDAEALRVLMRQIDNPVHKGYRHILLREAVGAAQRNGNREALMEIMPLYLAALEVRYSLANISDAIEREVDYQISDYQCSKEALDREINDRRETLHKAVVLVSAFVALILLVLLFLLYRLYTRSKRLARSLAQSNEALTGERDKLRRSERDLIAARDRATQASTMKTDFISNMSREVSAPLNSIIEYSQFIVDNMDAGRRKYMERFADVVTLSGELLQTLINDVLDTSSIERSEMEINKRPIPVNSICNLAIASMSKRMKPGVELICDVDMQSDSIITTDPQRVEQVLINLLSNAAKFTDEGSVSLSYAFDAEHKHITFAVADTGIGIPAGKETVIFERFEKLDSHTQGSGLGLYISSLLARLLGGEIRVDTAYTDGARFLFTIPV